MLSIGDTLHLQKEEGEIVTRYKCKVMNIDEKNIFTDYPVDEATGKICFFMTDQKFMGSFLTKTDKVNYTFMTFVVGRVKENNIPMLMLSRPSEEGLSKEQRREFVRVEAFLPVAVHPDVSIKGSFPQFTSQTIDLSAGGCAVITKKEKILTKNMQLMVYIAVPDEKKNEIYYMKINARVVRDAVPYTNRQFLVSIAFCDMNEAERQKLVRYSFARQLEARKKGLK
ncbi:MAG: flagellar brake protein [Bacilli bacterium]